MAFLSLPDLDSQLQRQWTAPPLGHFVIGPGLLVGSRATFLLYDSADSPGYGLPYRAIVEGASLPAEGGNGRRRWEVSAVESMCPSCFGTGVLTGEGRLCDTCGATGWGNADVVATTPAPGVPAVADARPA
ncbi:MAG: hypothetical protein ACKVT1_09020 [Dehalococcoidia bacterium]